MMEKKLRKYINRKFFLYPKTEKIIEVREELYSLMVDKYKDCLASGTEKEECYKQALEMTVDYRNAVKEVETGSSMGALRKNLISTASFGSFFFLTLTAVYLFYSIVVLKSFEKTWLIPVGGAFVYLLISAFTTYQYAIMFNFRVLRRWGIGLIFTCLVPLLYVFPSLYFRVVQEKSVWGHSWLVLLVILLFYIITDYIVTRGYISVFERDLHIFGAGFVLTSIIYLVVSIRFHLWGSAWILYVLYLALMSLALYISEKIGRSE